MATAEKEKVQFNNDVYNHCNSCNQSTCHSVEGQYERGSDHDYANYKISYKVVKCKGCNTPSFRQEYHDFDEAFQDSEGDWDYPLQVTSYPFQKKEKIKKKFLPELVDEIYTESCAAYSQNSWILAGIGLRATIEAICNEQSIAGKELSTRINNMVVKGLISKKDSLRLHSIRFLGNDAAHEIAKPLETNLKAALTIVEHLLTTVYILDGESKGALESIIEDYPEFETSLNKNVGKLKVGDEFPLVKILGKDLRRLNGSTRKLEQELDKRIGTGEYLLLKFGVKKKFENSPTELQHYVVQAKP